jgi:hypothetical protein
LEEKHRPRCASVEGSRPNGAYLGAIDIDE